MDEINETINNMMTSIQRKKAIHLIEQDNGYVVGLTVFIKTKNGIYSLDQYGRAEWITKSE